LEVSSYEVLDDTRMAVFADGLQERKNNISTLNQVPLRLTTKKSILCYVDDKHHILCGLSTVLGTQDINILVLVVRLKKKLQVFSVY
jgi:hypothetical protein